MKKFLKSLTLIIVIALFFLTPGVSAVSNSLFNMVPSSASVYAHTTPNQSATVFNEDKEVYDLSTWDKKTYDYLLTQQLTSETNKNFHDTYPDNTLSNDKLEFNHRSPIVMINDTDNMATRGAYTTDAITLLANSYYKISVDYYVVDQANDAGKYAFGTFYLNERLINLESLNSWNTATFYVRTDKLTTATVTPKLYFGSMEQSALGGIYFDKFTVTAVSYNNFMSALESRNPNISEYYDLAETDSYTLVDGGAFNNTDFADETLPNAHSNNNISTAIIQNTLGFADQQDYFYHKDGMYKEVMLMEAYNSNASLTLTDYTLQPKPHEIYMFQFYSITPTITDNENYNSFDFMIGDICQPIETLPDYPHYNGWQLNTVFFIAGPKINQEYKFKFTLKNEGTTTGWACIDEFKIYKVNGSYATQNETALGVTSIIDQNSDSDTLDIPNGNFDLGKTADTVTVGGSSYPYPLVANNWETNTDTNGIVNLHATLWDDRFGEHPDQINNYDNSEYGNHVYMMHNTTPNQNILTSPVLTTKKGESTYISFDAYSTAPTTAYIFCDFTDTDGNTTNELILGKSIKINNDNWTRYEFEIIEDEFTSSRNYYLRFKMEGIGYTYIDNVRTVSTTSPTSIIDLTNILPIQDAWQTTNEIEFKYLYANGLYLQNIDEQKTIVENTISYDLTANEYFELIIEASGKNAYLGLSNYTGLLEVTSDDNDDNIEKPTKEYKLYLQAGDATTTVKIQTTLGITANEDITTNGEIFIKNIELNKIEKEEFDLAKTNSEHNNCIKILTASEEQDTEEEEEETTTADQNDFFGENWWFLIPSLITAIALFLGIAAFLLRKIKFDRHIVKKTTSYARDMRLKNQQNKIVAQKAAKVDNVVDESKNN